MSHLSSVNAVRNPLACSRGASDMESAVRGCKAEFVSLLKSGLGGGVVVEEMKPGETTAGATVFADGPGLRFWAHAPDFGHDGYHVTVNGKELMIRETMWAVGGSVISQGPIDVSKAVSGAIARLRNNSLAAEQGKYTVLAGDTLYRLAREFDISVSELKRLNGLSGDRIRVGEVLNVPLSG